MRSYFGLILALATVSSCQDKETKIMRETVTKDVTAQVVPTTKKDTDFTALEDLLKSERPNIALAQFIGEALGRNESAKLKIALEDISAQEIRSLLSHIQRGNALTRERYLYHGKSYANNTHLLRRVLIDESLIDGDNLSLRTQVALGVSNYLRSKALDEIIDSYDRQAAKLAQDLIPLLAHEFMKERPSIAQQIEKDISSGVDPKIIKEKITAGLLGLEVLSRTLRDANLSKADKHVLLGGGVLAGGLYLAVRDNKEFKRVVAQVNNIRQQVESIKAKYSEFVVLTSSLNEHAEQSISNLTTFSASMREAGREIRNLTNEAMTSAPGTSGVHSRRIVSFVDSRLRGKAGEPINRTLPDSITGRMGKIDSALSRGVNAIGGMSSSLDTMIGTSRRMANLLGIRLSSSTERTLNNVQSVASLVSMGTQAVALFQTGGISAALGAFGGGSPLGGDANARQLAIMDGKLDQVLENQRLMLEAQVETMNMIKNLAVMIDQYHETQMGRLDELRDYQLIQLEIAKSNLVNKEIKSCEQMINFRLASVWEQDDIRKNPYHNLGHIDILRSNLSSRINGMAGIRNLVRSSSEDAFRNCEEAFVKAFGTQLNIENPLLGIFETSEGNNLQRYSRLIYQPTLNVLRFFSNGKSLNEVPLHLPVRRLDDLRYKSDILPNASGEDALPFTPQMYVLDHLVSVKNTERYLTSLLLLYPIFEMTKNDWELSVADIVKTYLNSEDIEEPHSRKSAYFLSGALRVVQSAIAQEAMLAGEPIIPRLYSSFHTKLLNSQSCKSITDLRSHEIGHELFCALRLNTRLLNNYVKYVLLQKIVTSPERRYHFQEAYSNGNTDTLSRMLETNTPIIMKGTGANAKAYFRLSALGMSTHEENFIEILIPELNELTNDELVSYGDSMKNLLNMQDLLISELEKVHPIRRELKGEQLIQLWRYQ